MHLLFIGTSTPRNRVWHTKRPKQPHNVNRGRKKTHSFCSSAGARLVILSCTFALCHLVIRRRRLAQASPAGPEELPDQDSLQTHNICSRWQLSAAACRDGMNSPNGRRIPDTPGDGGRTGTTSLLWVGQTMQSPLLLPSPPSRVKDIIPTTPHPLPMFSARQLSSRPSRGAVIEGIPGLCVE